MLTAFSNKKKKAVFYRNFEKETTRKFGQLYEDAEEICKPKKRKLQNRQISFSNTNNIINQTLTHCNYLLNYSNFI